MLGQFLVEELEPEPEPVLELELELEPDDPDVPDDPEFPELLVVVDEPDEDELLLELVPLLPVPEFDGDELVVAAFATKAPPPTRPAVKAPTARVLRRRIFIGVVWPFLSCHHPLGWV
jgi:hypothetical protein